MRHRVTTALAVFAAAASSLVLAAVPASAADGSGPADCVSSSSCLVFLSSGVTFTGSTGGDNGVYVPPPPCIGVAIGDATVGSTKIINAYDPNYTPPSTSSPSPSPSPSPTTASATPSASIDASPTATSASPTASGASSTASDDSLTVSGASASPSILYASLAADVAAASPPADPSGLTSNEQLVLDQAKQILATSPPPSGEWYQITQDPAATAASSARCLTLPPYLWVASGSDELKKYGLNIPLETLADLAFNQLNTAGLSEPALNPVQASDTNLPTFVDVKMLAPARGTLAETTADDPFVYATAETQNGRAATVYAQMTKLTINSGAGVAADAKVNDLPQCSVVHQDANGLLDELGSVYTKKQMAEVGAGGSADCGVTYTVPGTYQLTVSIAWKACWAPGLVSQAGPPANCKPVPGAAGLAPTTSQPATVNVREIQSVNG
jgi:hypothetical protein